MKLEIWRNMHCLKIVKMFENWLCCIPTGLLFSLEFLSLFLKTEMIFASLSVDEISSDKLIYESWNEKNL